MLIEQSFFDFCAEISSITSTKVKKQIIFMYSEDEVVKDILRFLYDKNIVTGISKQKLNKEANGIDSIPIRTIIDLIEYLKVHNTGRDADIATCREYLIHMHDCGCNTTQLKLLSQIITKSLKLGVDTKLVNTVIPKLIPVHEIQQAQSLKDVKLKDGEWICLSQKMNGNRATYIDGKLLSRQGKEFNNLEHVIEELDIINREMFKGEFIFDGEIIRKNFDNLSDNENFRIGTGILNSDAGDKTSLGFVIFDVLPKDEFMNGESSATYKTRKQWMDHIKNVIEDYAEHITVVPFLYEGNDHSMIQECLNKMDSEGKEGCMLARDTTYKCKRHNGLLKVKSYRECSLKCVDIEIADSGKYKDTLGAVVCEYKNSIVKVGSGFNDSEREEFTKHPEKIIGRIVDVKYKEISRNKQGGESLQFPIFLGVRYDKEIPDVDIN